MTVPATAAATGLASISALKSHLKQAATALPGTFGTAHIKFTKHGDWVMGADEIEIGVDDLAAVNPLSFVTGYLCWPDDPKLRKQGPTDEVAVPLGHPTPLKHELPQHPGSSWQEMSGFSLRFVEGQYKGREGSYRTTSRGGLNAVRGLMDSVIAQLDATPETPVPVVSLGAGDYPHKVYGKTFFPVIDIDSWVGMDGGAAPAPEPSVEAPEEEAAPEAAAPETPAEPARRRRRA